MSAFLDVKFTVTLMRLTELDIHIESGDRLFTYYFRVPQDWLIAADLQRRVLAVAEKMYLDLNEGFRRAEPSDPNYLRVKYTQATQLTAAEVHARPWRTATDWPVWEPTPCIEVSPDGAYRKLHPQAFEEGET